MKQRIIAIAVAVFMVLTMVPMTGNATYATETTETHKHIYKVVLTEVVTAPTCTKDGKAYIWCECRESHIPETIPATGHTWVVTPAVEATCTESGLTEGKYCSVCGYVASKQKTVSKKGHKNETIPGIGATCTKSGLTSGKKCTVCGEITQAQSKISPIGHYKNKIKGYAATCQAEGLTDGYKCGNCGEMLQEQKPIAKLAHTEVVDKAVAATCTKEGKTKGIHCSACNEVIVAQQVVPAKGHTEVVDKGYAATCTKDGLSDGRHCSVCDLVITKQNTIKALGHTIVIEPAVKLSCTTDGKTIGKHCSVCNEVLAEQFIIYSFGHNPRETIVKAATKDEEGLVTKACTVCNKALGERTVPKIGTVKLSQTLYVYDLHSKTPDVIINDANGNPIDEENYDLDVPAERMFTGKYTYTVTFKNEYSGKVTMDLRIAPKTPAVKMPVALKKGLTAKWDNVYGKSTGYEVMVATNSKFTKNKKTVTIKKLNTTSKKITGLKSKTRYWVKVRAYKTVGSEKLYSSWSEVMTVVTK